MKWTALNGIGALFWLTGLYLALGVSHSATWGAWLPSNSLQIGGVFGLVGLVTLVWANLIDA